MKNIQPRQPLHLSPFARSCLEALVKANLAERVSLGGAVELSQDGKKVFSFQIASRATRLEEPISAGWIDVPLDSLSDLTASKMVALVERGAPRDFLDIYTVCQAELLTIDECWRLWRQRQILSSSDADFSRARLAIETHLERIALQRPLEEIEDLEQRKQAKELRNWFLNDFLRVNDE